MPGRISARKSKTLKGRKHTLCIVNGSGSDHIAPHASWSLFYRKNATEPVDARLCGAEVRLVGSTSVLECGRNVNVRAFGGTNVIKGGFDSVVCADSIDLDHSSERIRREAGDGREKVASGT